MSQVSQASLEALISVLYGSINFLSVTAIVVEAPVLLFYGKIKSEVQEKHPPNTLFNLGKEKVKEPIRIFLRD